jgi:hypothetical protein
MHANHYIYGKISRFDKLYCIGEKHKILHYTNRLCRLVVSVEDYKHRGPGFDFRALLRIFLRELGLERGPLSLVIG